MASEKKMITLMTSDGVVVEMEQEVGMMSTLIKNMIEDDCIDGTIPLPNVGSATLARVIEFCQKHVENNRESNAAADVDELHTWEDEFFQVPQDTVIDLIWAASFLHIQHLLDLAVKTVADMMRGRTPEEIRQIFHIKNDYTPQEEEEVRKANSWAFD